MIERYTLPEMGKVWTLQNKFQRLLDVEVSVAKAQGALKIIPPAAADAIASRSKFSIDRILEIEKTTKHDVIAFVSNVAENVGPDGRYVHFGLTSSDVLDTAVSLQIREASKILDDKLAEVEASLKTLVLKHKNLICVGRTHGMHAEPTTLGLKFAGFLAELRRNRVRVKKSCDQAARVKLSGAVGTYSTLGPEVEAAVARDLGLEVETIATQVIPRDRHAEIFSSLALLGAGFERLAVEIRHLQRSEVGEVEEPFDIGQKGSSAMPHKRNPITSENITGLARLLRGYLVCAVEDIALWHERDISHSSVERVIFPDGFIIAHYAAHRLNHVLRDLRVYEERMRENIARTGGVVFSSHILLELVKSGLSREDAYKIVQGHAHSLKPGENLKDKLWADPEVQSKISEKTLDLIFSGASYRKHVEAIIARL